MLELVVLPGAFGMRNVSPFCLKLEMLLTSLELPFTLTELGDPRKTPKGKLPFLIQDGVRIADSELIAEKLNEMTDGAVYAGLTPEQKSRGVALARLAEDHLYWMIVASRWLDADWFPNVVQGFFANLPGPVRWLASRGARKQVASTYRLHGLGGHTLEEQKGFARRDLAALDGAIPDSGFLFGETPGIFDFTLTSMITSIVDQKPVSWISPLGAEYPRLAVYAERVQSHVGVYARK